MGDSKNQNSRESGSSVSMLEHQHHQQQHHHPQMSSMNADPAAAMQLFLMNPAQTRSPSPTPNSGTTAGGFGQFTWVPDAAHHQAAPATNPHEIGGVVEGQGLSLSLSSSLQHLEAAKAEELRMGDTGFLYFNHQASGGAAGSSSSAHYPYKTLNFQGSGSGSGSGQNHPAHVGLGSSLGVVHVLRNSKYSRAAQELLEEFCSVGRGQFKRNKFSRQNSNPSSNPNPNNPAPPPAASSSSSKDPPPLSAADRIEHQRRKVKLLSMLDEACNSLSLSHP